MASPTSDRTVALSLQLSRTHRDLLRRIDDLRSDPGSRRPDEDPLSTHCLAFCEALTAHHEGEDEGLFAQLLRERPDLAPTIAKLVEDHGLISGILSRVRALALRAAGSAAAEREAVRRELDGLAAIMESHFRYEERAISAALDATTPLGDWPDPVFRPGPAAARRDHPRQHTAQGRTAQGRTAPT
ncbi:hemerythrin domain-containing protein [Kitasatospora sp. NPDC004723]|uniref:hemerythrin domain-containing protein n=1 Tax=Kitasatospora sp. NPDC004723 TaxID=3154288 RepID=UPI0033B83624